MYKITFFCLCIICTGKWHGHLTSSGRAAVPGLTAACPPSMTKEKWIILIEGIGLRECSTVGSAIGANHIDVLVPLHEEALRKGVKRRRVWKMWKRQSG